MRNYAIAKRARVTIVEAKLRRLEQLIDEKQYVEMFDAFEAQLTNTLSKQLKNLGRNCDDEAA